MRGRWKTVLSDPAVTPLATVLVRRRVVLVVAAGLGAAIALALAFATSSSYSFDGFRYPLAGKSKPFFDQRIGRRVLLAEIVGNVMTVRPGAATFPRNGTFNIRARLAVADPGASYTVGAGFGAASGAAVPVDTTSFRWYPLATRVHSNGGAFSLRFLDVIRPLGPGLYVDRVVIASTNRPTVTLAAGGALTAFLAALLVVVLTDLVAPRVRRGA